MLPNFFIQTLHQGEKRLDFAIMGKISKTYRPSFRMWYVSSVHCPWVRK